MSPSRFRDVVAHLCCLDISLLEDLLDPLVLVRGAELVLKGALAGGVQNTLGAVAGRDVRHASLEVRLRLTCR